MTYHDIADNTGVRVMAERCETCIFRPGNLMSLQPGRVRDMVNEAKAKDGAIVCHDTLDDDKQAVCKGFNDRHATSILQVAARLGKIVPHRRK